jgi:hypothetical protein
VQIDESLLQELASQMRRQRLLKAEPMRQTAKTPRRSVTTPLHCRKSDICVESSNLRVSSSWSCALPVYLIGYGKARVCVNGTQE